VENTSKFMDVNPEVADALKQGMPVVALESTIISHGMPYPANVETALRVEQIVRAHGAIPATIGIIDGRLKVGLTKDEVVCLGQSQEVSKVSRRDLAFIVAAGRHGATTVSATMIIAEMAGISVFATGGIGGVHRGAGTTFDISADLTELAQTNVAVVCAGCKSILDIGLTLEYLETAGVPVIGYGTEDFPAFYTRRSGFGVDYRLDSPHEIARAVGTKWQLGLEGGVVIANPIPREYELDSELMEKVIEQAITEAEAAGVKGKEITPYLLSRVTELTAGKSLQANIELICHNARVGAEVALALASL